MEEKNKIFNDVTYVELDIAFSGRGCINYDTPNQLKVLRDLGIYRGRVYQNGRLSKKVFKNLGTDQNNQPITGFHHIVSSDCLRHLLFKEITNDNNLAFRPLLLYKAITTIPYLVRGYMFPVPKIIRRKTVLCLTDAQEDDEYNTTLNLQVHSNATSKCEEAGNGEEVSPEVELSKSTSLFYKEHIGDIKYKCKGYFDCGEAQFISADVLYDRDAVGAGVADDDKDAQFNKGEFIRCLNDNFGENGVKADYDYGYYCMEGSIFNDEMGERGILLNQKDVNKMLHYALNNLLGLKYFNNGAFIKTESVTAHIYQHGSNEPVTITLTNPTDVEDLVFNYWQKYLKADEDKVLANKAESEKRKEEYEKARTTKNKEKKNSRSVATKETKD